MVKNNIDIENCLKKISDNNCADSFRILYNHYYNRLFRQALYYLNNNPDCAQEVVSDVFIALWQGRKLLKNVSNPDSYIFIALKHAAAHYVEKNFKQNHELLTENLPDIHAADNKSDNELIEEELQKKYRDAMNNLPPRCAEVFRLVREEKKKYSEVAETLGISPKTVDNQMNKAVKLLYEQLKDNLFVLFF
jgi:RNA polymerase sigma-70 factor, Bacteroides expansion family 1